MSTNFNNANTAFGVRDHDHGRCQDSALNEAEALCAKRGVRLTPLRRQVLAIVWQRHAPVGAYEILEALGKEAGQRMAPPSVYRSLEFLLEQGLIHRIESLNAYIGCPLPSAEHSGHFLLCRGCGAAAEISDPRIHRAITEAVSVSGFAMEREVVELRGLCRGCQAGADGAAG